MNNTLIRFVFTLTLMLAATVRAELSWIALESLGYGEKTGASYRDSYRGYYCTTETAQALGLEDATAVSDYVKANFDTVWEGEATGVEKFVNNLWYNGAPGYYDFSTITTESIDFTTGYGLLLFTSGSDRKYQVYTMDNVIDGGKNLTFDGTGEQGTIPDWATANVPEPTSGLLLLLGVAALALKRRR